MNSYLREAKKLLSLSEPLLFVIGNESCDLDSAVSAISLAYFHARIAAAKSMYRSRYNILPVLNVPRTNLPLKTEVTYFLQQNSIDLNNIICRDEISNEILSLSKIILVDHNNPGANITKENIEEIIDHHQVIEPLPINTKSIISDVGSCATLIADIILNANQSDDIGDILQLLHGPIVLDTVNFSKEADKTRPLDVSINKQIENLLGLNENERKKLFDQLVKARSDVSSLDSLQILSKDLKIISNMAKTITVAIPGYPILVQEYMTKTDVATNLILFGQNHNCDGIVLMGMKVQDDGSVQRDLGIITLKSSDLTERILNALSTSVDPDLQLETNVIASNVCNSHFFKQKNIRASRKQISPIVQRVLAEF